MSARHVVSTTYKEIIVAIDGCETDVLAPCQTLSVFQKTVSLLLCLVSGSVGNVTDSANTQKENRHRQQIRRTSATNAATKEEGAHKTIRSA